MPRHWPLPEGLVWGLFSSLLAIWVVALARDLLPWLPWEENTGILGPRAPPFGD